MPTGKEHPNKKEIVAALLAGEKYQWIADTYKCGVATITHYRKKLKLPNRKDFRHPNREGITQMLNEGHGQGAIIAKYGCSESTVSRYRKLIAEQNTPTL
jgi:DNA-binding CsgD family transcriptional regulator